MKHIINAEYGDTIIIRIPSKPKAVHKQAIVLQPKDNTKVMLTDKHYDLINNVCAALDISLEDLQGTRRNQIYVAARSYIAHQLRACNISFNEIGKVLHKDHSSIIHAVNTFQKRTSVKDAITMTLIEKIQNYEASKN